MKLSILIPIYNWDITLLYQRLLEEIDVNNLSGEVEIILADDCSTDPIIIEANYNNSKNIREYVSFNQMEVNVGRSGIRNWLAQRSRGDFLLFLDCDVLPDSETFVSSYIEIAYSNRFDVVSGGRSYNRRIMNDIVYDFHLYFGNRKEVKSACERNKTPWRHLLTSNVMVRKKVYEKVPFNESFVGYGYEDVEWAIRLSRNYRILHIDNTASHLGLVSKEVAYDKMRQSVSNYILLRALHSEAFNSAYVGRAAAMLGLLPDSILEPLGGFLKISFFHVGSRFSAFVIFQLNFAVLLAIDINKTD